jgi:membrane-bound lytic murein transglycosylase B
LRTIFYGIYAFGAVLSALCMLLLDPAIAMMVVMITPLAAMWGAEQFGLIHFRHINLDNEVEQWANSFLEKAAREGLTDEQALEKYGQQIINEVENRIVHAEAQVTEMKRSRNEMIRIMREDKR